MATAERRQFGCIARKLAGAVGRARLVLGPQARADDAVAKSQELQVDELPARGVDLCGDLHLVADWQAGLSQKPLREAAMTGEHHSQELRQPVFALDRPRSA